MKRNKTTSKNLKKRTKEFVNYVLDPQRIEDSSIACIEFDTMLDTLLGNDYFGTEGQSDPRGDHRDD